MDSIGQQLKAARERKGVTASQAAVATRMKVQQVEALERDDYSRLTVPTYAKGFLRLYAEYLGIDAAPLVSEYSALRSGPAVVQPAAAPAAAPEGSIFKSPRRPLPVASAPTLTLPPELLARLLQGAGVLVVLLLLVWGVRHGCQRAPRPAAEVAPPPVVASQPRTEAPPIVTPAKREPPAPWIIVNEPPSPYLKRGATSAP